jgi:hypothetical protein
MQGLPECIFGRLRRAHSSQSSIHVRLVRGPAVGARVAWAVASGSKTIRVAGAIRSWTSVARSATVRSNRIHTEICKMLAFNVVQLFSLRQTRRLALCIKSKTLEVG